LWPVKTRAKERFTRGTAIYSPPVPHSLREQPRCAQRKQGELGAADHWWHSERSTKVSTTQPNGTNLSNGRYKGVSSMNALFSSEIKRLKFL